MRTLRKWRSLICLSVSFFGFNHHPLSRPHPSLFLSLSRFYQMEPFYPFHHFTASLLESEPDPCPEEDHPSLVATPLSNLAADGQALIWAPTWPCVVNDGYWHCFAPSPEENPKLLEILIRAYNHPLASNNQENITKSLEFLSRMGLIIDPDQHTSLGAYICNTVLNYGLTHNKPCPYRFALCTSTAITINIPSRSRLLLLYFADLFQMNIFLFSSRKSAKFFPCPGTTSCIAIYHRINSYFGTSEYLPLLHEDRVQLPLLHPPQPPPFTSTIPAAALRLAKKRARTSRPNFGDIKGNCTEALKTVW